jgi:hypothetical protein
MAIHGSLVLCSATALACLLAGAGTVLAQQKPAVDAPPPALRSESPTKPAPARGQAQRPAVQLTPAERDAMDAAAAAAVKPASIEDALVPTADDAKAKPDVESRTRIEQRRVSNRVDEIIVTPAGSTHSYVIMNREGRMPYGTTQMNSGLSVPMFFRFEFGRTTAPASPTAPPPAPSSTR